MDEAVSIHEKIGDGFKGLHARGFLTYTWVVAVGIFVIVVLLAFLKFLVALPTKTRNLFLLAGIVFVGGALGLEMVGGYIKDVYGSDNMTYERGSKYRRIFRDAGGNCLYLFAVIVYELLYERLAPCLTDKSQVT